MEIIGTQRSGEAIVLSVFACREQIDTLWDEVKRFENPHNYYVDLSQKLWDIKQDLLRKNYR